MAVTEKLPRATDTHARLMLVLAAEPPPATIDRLAVECCIKPSTATGYLTTLLWSGHRIWRADLERLFGLTAAIFDRVAAALPAADQLLSNMCRLKALKDQLPDAISYEHIRLVLAYRTVREHVRTVAPDGWTEPDPYGCDEQENVDRGEADKADGLAVAAVADSDVVPLLPQGGCEKRPAESYADADADMQLLLDDGSDVDFDSMDLDAEVPVTSVAETTVKPLRTTKQPSQSTGIDSIGQPAKRICYEAEVQRPRGSSLQDSAETTASSGSVPVKAVPSANSAKALAKARLRKALM